MSPEEREKFNEETRRRLSATLDEKEGEEEELAELEALFKAKAEDDYRNVKLSKSSPPFKVSARISGKLEMQMEDLRKFGEMKENDPNFVVSEVMVYLTIEVLTKLCTIGKPGDNAPWDKELSWIKYWKEFGSLGIMEALMICSEPARSKIADAKKFRGQQGGKKSRKAMRKNGEKSRDDNE